MTIHAWQRGLCLEDANGTREVQDRSAHAILLCLTAHIYSEALIYRCSGMRGVCSHSPILARLWTVASRSRHRSSTAATAGDTLAHLLGKETPFDLMAGMTTLLTKSVI